MFGITIYIINRTVQFMSSIGKFHYFLGNRISTHIVLRGFCIQCDLSELEWSNINYIVPVVWGDQVWGICLLARGGTDKTPWGVFWGMKGEGLVLWRPTPPHLYFTSFLPNGPSPNFSTHRYWSCNIPFAPIFIWSLGI